MLFSRKRGRLTIMAEILGIARSGTLKTQIMNRAGLGSTQLDGYLSFLQEAKLLRVDTKGRITYSTTPKGVRYLETYSKLIECIHSTNDLRTTTNTPSFHASEGRQVFIIDR